MASGFSSNSSIAYSLRTLLIENERAKRYAYRCFDRILKEGGFDRQRRWLSKFYRPQIESGLVPNVEIRWIDDRLGYGAFATAPFDKSACVGVYTGVLRRRNLLKTNSNNYCFRYPLGSQTFRPLMIDAEEVGNELRFVNHSERPNCESIGVPHNRLIYPLFLTTRPIAPGEQLLFDYGEMYWKGQKIPKLDI